MRGVDRGATGSRHVGGHSLDYGGGSVCSWAVLEMARSGSGGGDAGTVFADFACIVPAGSSHGISKSGFRSQRCRISIAAIADCGWLGRIYRRGADGEQAEIVLLAGSAYGFYLCGDLRGIGIHWRGGGDYVVCGVRVARIASGVQCPGWIREEPGAGRDGDGAVPVAD